MSLSVMVSTDNQTILWVSADFLDHAQCTAADLVGSSMFDVVDRASHPVVRELLSSDGSRNRSSKGAELTIAPLRGTPAVYWVNHVRYIGSDGQTIAYVGVRPVGTEDLTTAETTTQLTTRQNAQASHEAIVTTDAEGRINGWTTAAAVLYGWLFDEVRGRGIGEVLGAPDPRIELHLAADVSDVADVADGNSVADRNDAWNGPARHRHRDGRALTVHSESTIVRNSSGTVQGLLVVSRLIRGHSPNQYDELTGLVGRTTVLSALGSAEPDGSSMVLLVDIDHFSDLNARLGETVGDAVLIAVADRLTRSLRGDDFVARLGADRFCVIGCIDRGAEAEALAARLERLLAEPLEVGETLLSVSSSLGAAWGVHGKRGVRLFERAERALRDAQAKGGRRLCFYEPGVETGGWHDDDVFAAEVRTALQTGAIHVAYQPIVELGSGRLRKVEALARWTHPDRGSISPAQFIPPAERSGVIDELGEWILERACNDVVAMRAEGVEVSLSVNMSAVQLRDPDVARRVQRVLSKTAFPADQLWIEVTESVLVDDEALAPLAQLHDLGVHLVIDDFGTGYATLQYLSRLPVDALKIDMSFVWGLGVETSDTAIVRSVVNLGRELGLQVVAEGVETESQRTQLIALNCRLAQGWLFGRAVPYDELVGTFGQGRTALHNDRLPPAIAQETMRIAALEACRILDTSAERSFDSLVELAAQLLSTPMALFCLVDADREWFKASVGVTSSEFPRGVAFCSHTIADPHQSLVVEDASLDHRFNAHPLVTGDASIRAFVGVPILSREDLALGVFCVLDTVARTFTDQQIRVLQSLAEQASTLLDLRRRVAELNDLMYSRTQASSAIDLLAPTA